MEKEIASGATAIVRKSGTPDATSEASVPSEQSSTKYSNGKTCHGLFICMDGGKTRFQNIVLIL